MSTIKVVICVLIYLCVNVFTLDCYTCYHPVNTNNTCYHVYGIDFETCENSSHICVKLRRESYITSRSCQKPCKEFIRINRNFKCYECDTDLCNSVGTTGHSLLLPLTLNFILIILIQ
ncbi:uncharacterized protein LOC126265579 [Aethina tumida]|uniref:uncharacterized protein LOC126265579 n=1 Tax=Aethina tumida TaxID=116153 RepID=UPI0021497619|nr:uncharacterized protein LOC126265579 [Aethina tumida]